MIRRLCRTCHLSVCLAHPATLPTAPSAQGKLHNLVSQSPTGVFSVFAPVPLPACQHCKFSLSSVATSSVTLSLISLGRCPSSLFQVPTALCKCLHESTLLYCTFFFFLHVCFYFETVSSVKAEIASFLPHGPRA